MLRRLYDWTINLAKHRFSVWFLGIISFVESSFFPIPPDTLLIPMIIARPRRAFYLAAVATLGSVFGAMLGYMIGSVFLDSLGMPILEFYGKSDAFQEFTNLYNTYGAVLILVSGITPFPFKIITILSGMTGLDFWSFILFCIIARSIRFFLEAALLWKFGDPIRMFVEKYLPWVATGALAMLLGGFAVLYWI
ncbi:MAG TPA: YqaA family protein [Paracoccaceae bacterium]|nr:YqaA family protein [Paracoccaceae bacterium]